METPLINKAQKRAQGSLLFGLIWLMSPLLLLSLEWLGKGPLDPILPGAWSPTGVAFAKIIHMLQIPALILWVECGVACVLTAFPEPKNPRSWQGKTAVFLAILVILLLPLILLIYWLFS
jgi:hypothetical protein